jgi:type VI secretion system secreted protein VgrG
MPRVMEIATPLGADVLLFHGMHAREELGRLSDFQVDLVSQDDAIDPDGILGKNVTVTLALPDDTTRYFNGYVTRFTQQGTRGGFTQYAAVVKPWLWFLTRTADCRIFQDMTVPDILAAVFADHPTADFQLELTGTYRPWTYCVQYRETDFNFISRLMEHEGIYYYFKHAQGQHTMVLTDSYSGHAPFTGYELLEFIAPDRTVRPDVEHISRWEFSRDVQPGVYVHDDYDAERPSVDLKTQKTLARGYTPSDYEVYDYPGYYLQKPDGEQYASVRIDEFGAQFETARGVTNARGLAVGCLFTLEGAERPDQDREYLVVSASHDLEFSQYEATPGSAGVDYRCTFVAMSSAQQFRPRRATPKPFVQGPQTAVVVGPAGDEIFTDKYGRVKVQFHWDRRGEMDENSSCWIRVSHPWAGKGWGSVATPRIGQEVIIDFLEGDPDQPIVIGRVYNEEQQPPFGFPAGAVVSGIKSDTHKGDGYNEISLDDTAGTEKITIHGQYDMNTVVEHDQTTTVHNNRTDRVDVDDAESVGNNQTCDVGVDQTITIGANRTETVGANESITVMADRDRTVNGSESVTVMMQRTHTVGINETINVGVAQEITIGAMQAFTVGANQSTNVGMNQSTEVGGNQTTEVSGNRSVTVTGNESMSVTGAETRAVTKTRTTTITEDDALTVNKNLTMTVADSITIKTGDASITMNKDGTITIKGKDITIDGSGKINIKAGGDIIMKGSKILQN